MGKELNNVQDSNKHFCCELQQEGFQLQKPALMNIQYYLIKLCILFAIDFKRSTYLTIYRMNAQ